MFAPPLCEWGRERDSETEGRAGVGVTGGLEFRAPLITTHNAKRSGTQPRRGTVQPSPPGPARPCSTKKTRSCTTTAHARGVHRPHISSEGWFWDSAVHHGFPCTSRSEEEQACHKARAPRVALFSCTHARTHARTHALFGPVPSTDPTLTPSPQPAVVD